MNKIQDPEQKRTSHQAHRVEVGMLDLALRRSYEHISITNDDRAEEHNQCRIVHSNEA